MKNSGYFVLSLIFIFAWNSIYATSCDTIRQVLTGSLTSKYFFIPKYISVQVPKNAIKFSVEQSWHTPDGSKCNIDMGLFDEKGTQLNGKGFRGWSGGARRSFEISESFATPGYIPGKIKAGEWNIVQMLVKDVPKVEWKLIVTIVIGKNKEKPFVPVYAKKQINDLDGWYRIDTHVHTVHSDGKNTPEEVAVLAKNAGLDGIISTDHNTYSALEHWGKISQDSLLVINGIEVTYIDGHWNIFGLDPKSWVDFRFRYTDSEKYQQSVALAKQVGKFTVVNHPYSIEYKYDKSFLDGIEVWNGPWDETDEKAVQCWNQMLVAGAYKVAIGGSDYHNKNNQIGLPHMVIKSEKLASDAIIQGIKSGTSYIVRDQTVLLKMMAFDTANPTVRAAIGEYLTANSIVAIQFLSSVAGTLSFINQQGICYRGQINAGETIFFHPEKNCKWIRAELRDSQGNMIALTNPIFITSISQEVQLIP